MKLAHVLHLLLFGISSIVVSEGAVIETADASSLVRRALPKLVTTKDTPTSSAVPTSSTGGESSTVASETPSSSSSSSSSDESSTSSSKESSGTSSSASVSSSSDSSSTTSSDSSSTITSTSFTSYSSYSTSSSSITPSPVYIPSAENNKYVYHVKQPSGTVYTAFGSCLGFIVLVLFFVWFAFAIKSWKNARNEYQIREREHQYQYDPYFFQYGDGDGFSSDSDMASDISEKVLKQKSSRMSLYSLGGGSAFNLLSSEKVNEKPQQQPTNNPRLSMFTSPTELLKNEGNNWSSENSAFNSVSSTPKEQPMAQIISNPAGKSNSNGNVLFDNAVSKLQIDGTPESVQLRPNDNKKRKFRPPSAHLDDLLDGY